jgi:hypothetical protein
MKNNIYKLVFLFTATLLVSCDKDLDINTDPNAPEHITKGLALASAEASLVTVVGGELTNLGGFYAQYHTQSPSASQYETIDQYNINTTYADRLWTELYAGCLNDLQFIEDEAAADGDTGSALIAVSLKAYTFQILVDLFNDIPYTEALQGINNITPAVTPGEEVYADLLVKIDAALAAYEANPVASDVGAQDGIYGGDMNDWVKFANTLKLKIYIRMSYTPMANPDAVNALLADDNFITSDAAFTNFDASLNKTNPFYGVEISNQGIGLGDVNNIASSSLLEFYIGNDDPRMKTVYRYRPADATYVGLPQGAGAEFSDTSSSYSRPNIRQRTPVFLMTVAESNFLQAEGLIRYDAGAGAKEKYDAGVAASFATYQANFFIDPDKEVEETAAFTPAEALEFAQNLTAPGGFYEYEDAGSVEANVRQVIIQKWAALAYVNNIESYIETTRTKFPEIVSEGDEDYTIGNRIPSRISVLSGNSVPSILFYPTDEVNRNPNITQHTSLTEKVWWDQKN